MNELILYWERIWRDDRGGSVATRAVARDQPPAARSPSG